MTKPWIHILGALGIWVFVVAVMVLEQNNTITLRLDQIKTYTFQKIPSDWDGSFNLLLGYFATNWVAADEAPGSGCMQGVWLNMSTECAAKRKGLVTQTRQLLGCDKYRSPFCYCVNQVIKGIANDIKPELGAGDDLWPENKHSVNQPFDGVTFSVTAKNMSGMKFNITKAIESCHYLHHNTHTAKITSSTWVRRTHLLFILSTLVTGMIAYSHFLLPIAYADYFLGVSKLMRFLFVLVWPAVSVGTCVLMEQGTQTILMWLALPPLIHLLWYEFLLPDLKHEPLVHPFMFDLILCTFTLIALVENGVLDYDNLFIEIWKCHMISYLYFGTCWFHLFMDNEADPKKAHYVRKPAQETIYISIVLAVLSSLSTIMAPYTTFSVTNYLFWVPNIFTVIAFVAVIWVNQMDRFSDVAGHAGMRERYDSISQKRWYVTNGNMYIAALILLLTTSVTVFYWRDFSVIVYSVWQQYATRSIQMAPDLFWLNPAI